MDNDPNETLEQIGSERKPDLDKIKKEIEQANTDASGYMSSYLQSRAWWHCEWPGISPDGRTWKSVTGRDSFPWDGCCFSLDTDLLTGDGWRPVSEVRVGDMVYTRAEDGVAEYRPVSQLTRNYSDIAVELRGKSIDLQVTPNHRMVVHDWSGRQRFVQASDLVERRYGDKTLWIPLVSEWHAPMPTKIFDMPARSYVRLLGWYISEGSQNNGGTIGIAQCQNAHADNCRIIESDLTEAGITWKYSGNTYWLHSTSLSERFKAELRSIGTSKEKQLPNHVFSLSSELLRELLETMVFGDGSIRPNGHASYYTNSKELAGQVQELAQKIGKRATIVFRPPRGGIIRGKQIKPSGCYTVNINTKGQIQTNKLSCAFVQLKSITEFACVNVPPHHTLYVRRNGKAVWCGNSDSRPRTVETLVNEHATICLAAFWSAKVQAKSAPGRQFAHAVETNITQKMLNWAVYTQMKRELINELPMAFQWKWGFGLAFLGVEWEQQRQLSYVPISLDMLSQIGQEMGVPDIAPAILDGDRTFDPELAQTLQLLSPVLPTSEAKKILTELRNTGNSQLPVANLRVNKPRWTALRPFVDLWFPSETVDIQQARWTARRELVSESELTDRIVTDGYDDKFVEKALEHKGEFGGVVPVNGLTPAALGSDRDLVELFHFRARVLDYGVPCMYKTILNMAVASDGLYAVHRKDEYEHQQQPFIALARKGPYRPLLSRMGIAAEAYTDEIDIKRQQDGLNDRTDLIHQPPIIVPPGKAGAVASSYGPRSVMTSLRPDVIHFPPLPPLDQTPVLVMQFVLTRLNRRYPVQNAEGVDPQMVMMYRQELATDTLSELELAFEQTLQLGQQYWTEQDVAMVAGGKFDWNYTQQQIQKQATVVATVDMSLVDPEQAKAKLGMMAELMPFKDQGGLVFNAAASLVDTDLADALTEDQMSPTALKKEKDDEYAAWGQIGGGIVPQKPQMANNQLRLQTIMQEILTQPQVQQRMAQDKMFAQIAQDRIKYFQLQIQQYSANPQIGRTLATQPFNPSQPAPVTNAQAG